MRTLYFSSRLLSLVQSIGNKRETALKVVAWEEVYDVIKQVCAAVVATLYCCSNSSSKQSQLQIGGYGASRQRAASLLLSAVCSNTRRRIYKYNIIYSYSGTECACRCARAEWTQLHEIGRRGARVEVAGARGGQIRRRRLQRGVLLLLVSRPPALRPALDQILPVLPVYAIRLLAFSASASFALLPFLYNSLLW